MSNRNPMLAKLHIAKKELRLDDETYRAVLSRVTGKTSSAGLKDHQLDAVLAEFKRLGWKPKKAGRQPSDKPHVRKVWAVWRDMVSLAIPADGSDAALRAFVARQTRNPARPDGIANPEWLSPEEANKVVEGLKAWRSRELGKRGQ